MDSYYSYMFISYAGLFLSASNLLCSVCNDIAHSESHVILLKCLVDAGEDAIATEHIDKVQQISPSISQVISSELVALLASSANPEPLMRLLKSKQILSGHWW